MVVGCLSLPLQATPSSALPGLWENRDIHYSALGGHDQRLGSLVSSPPSGATGSMQLCQDVIVPGLRPSRLTCMHEQESLKATAHLHNAALLDGSTPALALKPDRGDQALDLHVLPVGLAVG